MKQSNRWFRLNIRWSDSEFLVDLSPGARLSWIYLLGYCKEYGQEGRVKALPVKTAAVRWRVSKEDVQELLDAAMYDHALELKDGHWELKNWKSYQGTTSAARMRKYRASNRLG
jgi:hypothetical protein